MLFAKGEILIGVSRVILQDQPFRLDTQRDQKAWCSRAITLAFWQRGQDEVLTPYVEKYLTAAGEISRGEGGWPTRGYSLRENLLRFGFPVPEQLAPFIERLDAFLADPTLVDSVRRPILEGRDNAARSLRCQVVN